MLMKRTICLLTVVRRFLSRKRETLCSLKQHEMG